MAKEIDIVIVTYNRRDLLKRTINGINTRTDHPYRIIVIDNNSEDGTYDCMRRHMKNGEIDEYVQVGRNIGLARGYNIGLGVAQSEIFVTTNDDLIPPKLEPCWLTQLLETYERYYPEYGALSLRCPRLRNVHFEHPSAKLPHPGIIGEAKSALSAIFRVQRRKDILKNSHLFGMRENYNDELSYKKLMKNMGYRTGYVANLWADHIGWGLDNKGYPQGVSFHGDHAQNRIIEQQTRRPYPKIDPLTNVPLKGEEY